MSGALFCLDSASKSSEKGCQQENIDVNNVGFKILLTIHLANVLFENKCIQHVCYTSCSLVRNGNKHTCLFTRKLNKGTFKCGLYNFVHVLVFFL